MNVAPFFLGMALLAAGSAQAESRDPFVGEWAGNCRPDLQCWFEIDLENGGNYSVKYVAADRLNAQKVHCSVSTALRRNSDGWLVGKFGKHEPHIEILSGDGGSIVVGGTGNEPCGKPLAVNGVYDAVGD